MAFVETHIRYIRYLFLFPPRVSGRPTLSSCDTCALTAVRAQKPKCKKAELRDETSQHAGNTCDMVDKKGKSNLGISKQTLSALHKRSSSPQETTWNRWIGVGGEGPSGAHWMQRGAPEAPRVVSWRMFVGIGFRETPRACREAALKPGSPAFWRPRRPGAPL